MPSWGQRFALVGAICLVPATWAIYQYGIIGMPPALKTIAEMPDEKYEGKFGDDFKIEFISAINPENKYWWQKIYQEIYSKEDSNNLSNSFQNIQNKGLNEVCKEAYGKDLKTDFLSDEDKKKYLKDVIRFCSWSGERPKTVSIEKNQFLSTELGKNRLIWKILEKGFFKVGDQEGWGKSAQDSTAGFKALYEKDNRGTEDTLLNTCKKAYEMSENKSQEIKKFCSL